MIDYVFPNLLSKLHSSLWESGRLASQTSGVPKNCCMAWLPSTNKQLSRGMVFLLVTHPLYLVQVEMSSRFPRQPRWG